MFDNWINIMDKPQSLQQINTNRARETIAYADGDVVVCMPGPQAPIASVWLDKQKYSSDIAAHVAGMKNPAYFVPKTLEITADENGNPVVRKERATGHALDAQYVATLSSADMDIIYRAIANFINDMAHVRPIMSQREMLDTDIAFADVLNNAKTYLSPDEANIVLRAKDWFDNASTDDAAVVFAHGDMNGDNIFYDDKTHTVSFLDFADSAYQVGNYMLERDFAKLPWLDINRVRREYSALTKGAVKLESRPAIEKMRNALKNFKWSVQALAANPNASQKIINIRIADLQVQVKNIDAIYADVHSMTRSADNTSSGNVR